MKKIKFLLAGLLFSTSLFVSAQTTVIDSIVSGGIYRNYRLYVPAAYNGSTAWPLVFDLHGYTSSASSEQLYSNFMPIADTAHFLVVYPNGTLLSGQPYWNAGISASGVNDVQFISDLIDSLSASYNIDANSVYSCGMSNGGYMSHTLACALNHRIAAIASVTGSMFVTQRATCVPNRPVPVMQISGNADPTVPYTGSASSLSIDSVVHYWVNNDHCSASPVFNAVPDINTTDGCTAEHYVYNGGDLGSTVEFYKIIGGGHTWPGSVFVIGVTNEDFKASEKIWIFFRKYHLNQFVGIEEPNGDRSISVYPNPGTGNFTVKVDGLKQVEVMNLQGQRIYSGNSSNVDISNQASGIYFLKVLTTKGTFVQKLIKD